MHGRALFAVRCFYEYFQKKKVACRRGAAFVWQRWVKVKDKERPCLRRCDLFVYAKSPSDAVRLTKPSQARNGRPGRSPNPVPGPSASSGRSHGVHRPPAADRVLSHTGRSSSKPPADAASCVGKVYRLALPFSLSTFPCHRWFVLSWLTLIGLGLFDCSLVQTISCALRCATFYFGVCTLDRPVTFREGHP